MERFPVLANCLSVAVIEELIIRGKAKPFTPELSEIMDGMHCWGRSRNIEWYKDAIVVLDYYLDNEGTRKEIVSRLVEMEVDVEIHNYFGVGTVVASLLLANWQQWYDRTYSNGGSISFKTTAMNSLRHIEWAIAQVNYHATVVPVGIESNGRIQ